MIQQQDPFAKYRVNQPMQNQSQQPLNQSQSEGEDVFSKYRVNQPEGSVGSFVRVAAGNMARGLETILGTPGDVSNIAEYLTKPLANMLIPVDEEKKQEFSSRLPGSQDLREVTKNLTGDYLEPKGKAEEALQEGSQTLASLIGPMKFRKAIGVAFGSQLAKEGTKVLGLGENPQEAAKLGTMVMLTALNPGGAMKYASAQYEKAKQLARGATIQATNFQGSMQNLLKDLKYGVPKSNASKQAVIKPIEEILKKVKNNRILVEDLTAAKRDLNSIMKDPAVLTREKKLLKDVGRIIDDGIKPYEKINPAFGKAYRPANEIYGAVMQGTKAYDTIKKILGPKSVLATALGEAALGHTELVIPTIAGAAGAAGAAKTVDFFTRLARSPELQKYYTKAISAAVKEDIGALRIYADKIEEIIDTPHSDLYQKNMPK